MDDFKKTIVITGIDPGVTEKEYIKKLKEIGKIKTDEETGRILAEMNWAGNKKGKVGIVTFSDLEAVQKAIENLNGAQFGKVVMPDKYFRRQLPQTCEKVPCDYGYLAWKLWREQCARKFDGGLGGKGGESHTSSTGLFARFTSKISVSSNKHGHDGMPGSADGTGGKGGKPAIVTPGEDPDAQNV